MENYAEPTQIEKKQIAEVILADIPSHDIQADIRVSCQDLVNTFNRYPNLPGIIITQNGQFSSLISRKKFFEHLSKPFGVEVYLRRSAAEMLKHIDTPVMVLAPEMGLSQAVQKALSRKTEDLYEPIIVIRNDKHEVVDMYTLLIFMARSLDNANQIITKQFLIAHQLTEDIEYKNVFQSILEKTSNVISYDEGVILRKIENSWKIMAHRGQLPSTLIYKLIDTRLDDVLENDVRQSQQIAKTSDYRLQFDLEDLELKLDISSLIVQLDYSDFSFGALLLLRIKENKSYLNFLHQTGVSNKARRAFIPFQKLDKILLGNLETTFSSAIRNTQLISQIQDLAITDTLTNVRNRRGFFMEARQGFQNSKQNGACRCCILIVDIDHFKAVNDLFGHVTGDDAIRSVVEEIKTCLRETDLLGRYGGDEFVILLPQANIQAAESVATRIRRRINNMIIDTPKGEILVTVSIGIGEMDPENDDLDSLIKQADEALLLAKKMGRNQTVTWERGKFYNKGFPIASSLINKKNGDFESRLLPDHVGLNGIDDISLDQTIDDLIEGYVHALELRDKETEGHTQRVARMTIELALELGVDQEDLIDIKRGALLHDIGKIAIPDQILLKPGPLDEKEWQIMRKHTIYAFDLLSNNVFLRSCVDIPYNHHERWDGQGYPRKLEKEQIPLSARIFSLVDVWDALISQRTYRPAWSKKDALNYIEEQAGRQFDPEIVPHFIRLVKTKYMQ
jgi:diguanylate cyclase (GGDEF)-like protein/putative nucleotidyltransferase with HDIG domain